jgi:quaternary ammonium compound-resistance protein SugE
MAWLTLFLAALFEVAWAVGLKSTHGFTRLWPSVWVLSTMAVSIFLLAQAVRTLPIGTAYAVWTGTGAVGTAILGIVLLGESAALPRVICLLLVVAGIVGLKFFSPH